MVRIKTEDTSKWGQRNVIPFLGVTEIGTDGIVECPSYEIAKKVEESKIGFTIVKSEVSDPNPNPPVDPVEPKEPVQEPGEDLQPKTDNPDIGNPTESDITGPSEQEGLQSSAPVEEPVQEPQTTEDTPEEPAAENPNQELIDQINEADLTTLKAMAAEFPKEEWKSYTKKDEFKAYLIGKLN